MSRIHGVVTGQVTSVDDPDNQGRVQVSFPFLGGQNKSTWAPVATLMAGSSRGSWFMPDVGDEVLVAFNQGSVEHPFVIGFLWNGQDTPPETDNEIRTLVTPGGHSLRFEDKDGSKKVIVKSSSDQTITLDDTDSSITLQGGGRILKMSNGLVQIS
jgi:phage baseplate assembly protein V